MMTQEELRAQAIKNFASGKDILRGNAYKESQAMRDEEAEAEAEANNPGWLAAAGSGVDRLQASALGVLSKMAEMGDDRETSRYLEGRMKNNIKEAQEVEKDLTFGQQALASGVQMLPSLAASAIPGVGGVIGAGVLGGLQTAGDIVVRAEEEGKDVSGGRAGSAALAAGLADAAISRIPFGRALTNLPVGTLGRTVTTSAGQGALSGAQQQVFSNLAIGEQWDKDIGASALGGAVIGGGLGGINAALNFDYNDGGKEAMSTLRGLFEANNNVAPTDGLKKNYFEIENAAHAFREKMNSNNPQEIQDAINAKLNIDEQYGAGAALVRAQKLADKHGVHLTDSSLRFDLQNISKTNSLGNAGESFGVSLKDQEKAAIKNEQGGVSFFRGKSAQRAGDTPESHKKNVQDSGLAALAEARGIFSNNKHRIRDRFQGMERTGAFKDDSATKSQYLNLVNNLSILEDIMLKMTRGDKEYLGEAAVDAARRVYQDATELGLLGELKGLDGNFDPVNDILTVDYLERMLVNEYPSFHRGDPNLAKEHKGVGFSGTDMVLGTIAPGGLIVKKGIQGVGGTIGTLASQRGMHNRRNNAAAKRQALYEGLTSRPANPFQSQSTVDLDRSVPGDVSSLEGGAPEAVVEQPMTEEQAVQQSQSQYTLMPQTEPVGPREYEISDSPTLGYVSEAERQFPEVDPNTPEGKLTSQADSAVSELENSGIDTGESKTNLSGSVVSPIERAAIEAKRSAEATEAAAIRAEESLERAKAEGQSEESIDALTKMAKHHRQRADEKLAEAEYLRGEADLEASEKTGADKVEAEQAQEERTLTTTPPGLASKPADVARADADSSAGDAEFLREEYALYEQEKKALSEELDALLAAGDQEGARLVQKQLIDLDEKNAELYEDMVWAEENAAAKAAEADTAARAQEFEEMSKELEDSKPTPEKVDALRKEYDELAEQQEIITEELVDAMDAGDKESVEILLARSDELTKEMEETAKKLSDMEDALGGTEGSSFRETGPVDVTRPGTTSGDAEAAVIDGDLQARYEEELDTALRKMDEATAAADKAEAAGNKDLAASLRNRANVHAKEATRLSNKLNEGKATPEAEVAETETSTQKAESSESEPLPMAPRTQSSEARIEALMDERIAALKRADELYKAADEAEAKGHVENAKSMRSRAKFLENDSDRLYRKIQDEQAKLEVKPETPQADVEAPKGTEAPETKTQAPEKTSSPLPKEPESLKKLREKKEQAEAEAAAMEKARDDAKARGDEKTSSTFNQLAARKRQEADEAAAKEAEERAYREAEEKAMREADEKLEQELAAMKVPEDPSKDQVDRAKVRADVAEKAAVEAETLASYSEAEGLSPADVEARNRMAARKRLEATKARAYADKIEAAAKEVAQKKRAAKEAEAAERAKGFERETLPVPTTAVSRQALAKHKEALAEAEHAEELAAKAKKEGKHEAAKLMAKKAAQKHREAEAAKERLINEELKQKEAAERAARGEEEPAEKTSKSSQDTQSLAAQEAKRKKEAEEKKAEEEKAEKEEAEKADKTADVRSEAIARDSTGDEDDGAERERLPITGPLKRIVSEVSNKPFIDRTPQEVSAMRKANLDLAKLDDILETTGIATGESREVLEDLIDQEGLKLEDKNFKKKLAAAARAYRKALDEKAKGEAKTVIDRLRARNAALSEKLRNRVPPKTPEQKLAERIQTKEAAIKTWMDNNAMITDEINMEAYHRLGYEPGEDINVQSVRKMHLKILKEQLEEASAANAPETRTKEGRMSLSRARDLLRNRAVRDFGLSKKDAKEIIDYYTEGHTSGISDAKYNEVIRAFYKKRDAKIAELKKAVSDEEIRASLKERTHEDATASLNALAGELGLGDTGLNIVKSGLLDLDTVPRDTYIKVGQSLYKEHARIERELDAREQKAKDIQDAVERAAKVRADKRAEKAAQSTDMTQEDAGDMLEALSETLGLGEEGLDIIDADLPIVGDVPRATVNKIAGNLYKARSKDAKLKTVGEARTKLKGLSDRLGLGEEGHAIVNKQLESYTLSESADRRAPRVTDADFKAAIKALYKASESTDNTRSASSAIEELKELVNRLELEDDSVLIKAEAAWPEKVLVDDKTFDAFTKEAFKTFDREQKARRDRVAAEDKRAATLLDREDSRKELEAVSEGYGLGEVGDSIINAAIGTKGDFTAKVYDKALSDLHRANVNKIKAESKIKQPEVTTPVGVAGDELYALADKLKLGEVGDNIVKAALFNKQALTVDQYNAAASKLFERANKVIDLQAKAKAAQDKLDAKEQERLNSLLDRNESYDELVAAANELGLGAEGKALANKAKTMKGDFTGKEYDKILGEIVKSGIKKVREDAKKKAPVATTDAVTSRKLLDEIAFDLKLGERGYLRVDKALAGKDALTVKEFNDAAGTLYDLADKDIELKIKEAAKEKLRQESLLDKEDAEKALVNLSNEMSLGEEGLTLVRGAMSKVGDFTGKEYDAVLSKLFAQRITNIRNAAKERAKAKPLPKIVDEDTARTDLEQIVTDLELDRRGNNIVESALAGKDQLTDKEYNAAAGELYDLANGIIADKIKAQAKADAIKVREDKAEAQLLDRTTEFDKLAELSNDLGLGQAGINAINAALGTAGKVTQAKVDAAMRAVLNRSTKKLEEMEAAAKKANEQKLKYTPRGEVEPYLNSLIKGLELGEGSVLKVKGLLGKNAEISDDLYNKAIKSIYDDAGVELSNMQKDAKALANKQKDLLDREEEFNKLQELSDSLKLGGRGTARIKAALGSGEQISRSAVDKATAAVYAEQYAQIKERIAAAGKEKAALAKVPKSTSRNIARSDLESLSGKLELGAVGQNIIDSALARLNKVPEDVYKKTITALYNQANIELRKADAEAKRTAAKKATTLNRSEAIADLRGIVGRSKLGEEGSAIVDGLQSEVGDLTEARYNKAVSDLNAVLKRKMSKVAEEHAKEEQRMKSTISRDQAAVSLKGISDKMGLGDAGHTIVDGALGKFGDVTDEKYNSVISALNARLRTKIDEEAKKVDKLAEKSKHLIGESEAETRLKELAEKLELGEKGSNLVNEKLFGYDDDLTLKDFRGIANNLYSMKSGIDKELAAKKAEAEKEHQAAMQELADKKADLAHVATQKSSLLQLAKDSKIPNYREFIDSQFRNRSSITGKEANAIAQAIYKMKWEKESSKTPGVARNELKAIAKKLELGEAGDLIINSKLSNVLDKDLKPMRGKLVTEKQFNAAVSDLYSKAETFSKTLDANQALSDLKALSTKLGLGELPGPMERSFNKKVRISHDNYNTHVEKLFSAFETKQEAARKAAEAEAEEVENLWQSYQQAMNDTRKETFEAKKAVIQARRDEEAAILEEAKKRQAEEDAKKAEEMQADKELLDQIQQQLDDINAVEEQEAYFKKMFVEEHGGTPEDAEVFGTDYFSERTKPIKNENQQQALVRTSKKTAAKGKKEEEDAEGGKTELAAGETLLKNDAVEEVKAVAAESDLDSLKSMLNAFTNNFETMLVGSTNQLEILAKQIDTLKKAVKKKAKESDEEIDEQTERTTQALIEVIEDAAKMKQEYPNNPEYWFSYDNYNKLKEAFHGGETYNSYIGDVGRKARAAIYGDTGWRDSMLTETEINKRIIEAGDNWEEVLLTTAEIEARRKGESGESQSEEPKQTATIRKVRTKSGQEVPVRSKGESKETPVEEEPNFEESAMTEAMTPKETPKEPEPEIEPEEVTPEVVPEEAPSVNPMEEAMEAGSPKISDAASAAIKASKESGEFTKLHEAMNDVYPRIKGGNGSEEDLADMDALLSAITGPEMPGLLKFNTDAEISKASTADSAVSQYTSEGGKQARNRIRKGLKDEKTRQTGIARVAKHDAEVAWKGFLKATDPLDKTIRLINYRNQVTKADAATRLVKLAEEGLTKMDAHEATLAANAKPKGKGKTKETDPNQGNLFDFDLEQESAPTSSKGTSKNKQNTRDYVREAEEAASKQVTDVLKRFEQTGTGLDLEETLTSTLDRMKARLLNKNSKAQADLRKILDTVNTKDLLDLSDSEKVLSTAFTVKDSVDKALNGDTQAIRDNAAQSLRDLHDELTKAVNSSSKRRDEAWELYEGLRRSTNEKDMIEAGNALLRHVKVSKEYRTAKGRLTQVKSGLEEIGQGPNNTPPKGSGPKGSGSNGSGSKGSKGSKGPKGSNNKGSSGAPSSSKTASPKAEAEEKVSSGVMGDTFKETPKAEAPKAKAPKEEAPAKAEDEEPTVVPKITAEIPVWKPKGGYKTEKAKDVDDFLKKNKSGTWAYGVRDVFMPLKEKFESGSLVEGSKEYKDLQKLIQGVKQRKLNNIIGEEDIKPLVKDIDDLVGRIFNSTNKQERDKLVADLQALVKSTGNESVNTAYDLSRNWEYFEDYRAGKPEALAWIKRTHKDRAAYEEAMKEHNKFVLKGQVEELEGVINLAMRAEELDHRSSYAHHALAKVKAEIEGISKPKGKRTRKPKAAKTTDSAPQRGESFGDEVSSGVMGDTFKETPQADQKKAKQAPQGDTYSEADAEEILAAIRDYGSLKPTKEAEEYLRTVSEGITLNKLSGLVDEAVIQERKADIDRLLNDDKLPLERKLSILNDHYEGLNSKRVDKDSSVWRAFASKEGLNQEKLKSLNTLLNVVKDSNTKATQFEMVVDAIRTLEKQSGVDLKKTDLLRKINSTENFSGADVNYLKATLNKAIAGDEEASKFISEVIKTFPSHKFGTLATKEFTSGIKKEISDIVGDPDKKISKAERDAMFKELRKGYDHYGDLSDNLSNVLDRLEAKMRMNIPPSEKLKLFQEFLQKSSERAANNRASSMMFEASNKLDSRVDESLNASKGESSKEATNMKSPMFDTAPESAAETSTPKSKGKAKRTKPVNWTKDYSKVDPDLRAEFEKMTETTAPGKLVNMLQKSLREGDTDPKVYDAFLGAFDRRVKVNTPISKNHLDALDDDYQNVLSDKGMTSDQKKEKLESMLSTIKDDISREETFVSGLWDRYLSVRSNPESSESSKTIAGSLNRCFLQERELRDLKKREELISGHIRDIESGVAVLNDDGISNLPKQVQDALGGISKDHFAGGMVRALNDELKKKTPDFKTLNSLIKAFDGPKSAVSNRSDEMISSASNKLNEEKRRAGVTYEKEGDWLVGQLRESQRALDDYEDMAKGKWKEFSEAKRGLDRKRMMGKTVRAKDLASVAELLRGYVMEKHKVLNQKATHIAIVDKLRVSDKGNMLSDSDHDMLRRGLAAPKEVEVVADPVQKAPKVETKLATIKKTLKRGRTRLNQLKTDLAAKQRRERTAIVATSRNEAATQAADLKTKIGELERTLLGNYEEYRRAGGGMSGFMKDTGLDHDTVFAAEQNLPEGVIEESKAAAGVAENPFPYKVPVRLQGHVSKNQATLNKIKRHRGNYLKAKKALADGTMSESAASEKMEQYKNNMLGAYSDYRAMEHWFDNRTMEDFATYTRLPVSALRDAEAEYVNNRKEHMEKIDRAISPEDYEGGSASQAGSKVTGGALSSAMGGTSVPKSARGKKPNNPFGYTPQELRSFTNMVKTLKASGDEHKQDLKRLRRLWQKETDGMSLSELNRHNKAVADLETQTETREDQMLKVYTQFRKGVGSRDGKTSMDDFERLSGINGDILVDVERDLLDTDEWKDIESEFRESTNSVNPLKGLFTGSEMTEGAMSSAMGENSSSKPSAATPTKGNPTEPTGTVKGIIDRYNKTGDILGIEKAAKDLTSSNKLTKASAADLKNLLDSVTKKDIPNLIGHDLLETSKGDADVIVGRLRSSLNSQAAKKAMVRFRGQIERDLTKGLANVEDAWNEFQSATSLESKAEALTWYIDQTYLLNTAKERLKVADNLQSRIRDVVRGLQSKGDNQRLAGLKRSVTDLKGMFDGRHDQSFDLSHKKDARLLRDTRKSYKETLKKFKRMKEEDREDARRYASRMVEGYSRSLEKKTGELLSHIRNLKKDTDFLKDTNGVTDKHFRDVGMRLGEVETLNEELSVHEWFLRVTQPDAISTTSGKTPPPGREISNRLQPLQPKKEDDIGDELW